MDAETDSQPQSDAVGEYKQQLTSLELSTNLFFGFVDDWRLSVIDSDPQAKAPSTIIIGRHVGFFVSAYDTGIDAARTGFTFAQDGIGLVEKFNVANPEEIAGYIEQMKGFASTGAKEAEETANKFRAVQRGIKAAIKANRGVDKLKGLEKNFDHVLENLEKCVNMFKRWWTRTGMLQNYQDEKLGEITDSNAKDKIPTTMSAWTELEAAYSQYVDKMKYVRDANADAFTFALTFVSAPQEPKSPIRAFSIDYIQEKPVSEPTTSEEKVVLPGDQFEPSSTQTEPASTKNKQSDIPSEAEEEGAGCCRCLIM